MPAGGKHGEAKASAIMAQGEAETAAALDVTSPPDFLSADGRKMWDTVCEALQSRGVLTVFDGGVLAHTCELYAECSRIMADLAKARKRRGNADEVARLRSHYTRMFREFRVAAEGFGLTPHGRVKVGDSGPVAATAQPGGNAGGLAAFASARGSR